jgi:transcription initiation factor TFIID subunit 2
VFPGLTSVFLQSASKSVDYLGLFYLFKIFQTLFCFEQEHEAVDAFSFRCVPRPNDFTDFAEYHLRKVRAPGVAPTT